MITSQPDFPLRGANTFRINVNCAQWIQFTSPEDMPRLREMLSGRDYLCIGQGSNMLFVADYPGAVVQSEILDIEVGDSEPGIEARVGSGVILDEFIRQCASQGIWGLENLSGIPGHVGASAVQNVGAYGVEAGDRIVKVEAYDMKEGRYVEFDNAACTYGYRDSIFKRIENRCRYIILYVTYSLMRQPTPVLDYGNLRQHLAGISEPSPLDVRSAVLEMRASKLPDIDCIGSAGSFFKNPVLEPSEFDALCSKADAEVPSYSVGDKYKVPAAWLIDQCGLKGYTIGGAKVWPSQPLVIVNASGNATADDIINLEHYVINTVKHKFGVSLHPEVEHIYPTISSL